MIMELHQLEYLVAVADRLSFTKAAEQLVVSQPGVSAQVRRLERELGAELFDRSGRSVRLTQVGAAVLPYARAALGAVAGVRQSAAELTSLLAGHLAIGTVTSHNVDLPAILAAFVRQYPGVEVTLSEAASDDLLAGLRSGRYDAVIASIGTTAPAGAAIHVIADEPVVAAVARGHELAGRRTIGIRTLRDWPLISLPAGTGLRARLEEACAAAGFEPRIAFEASSPEVLAELAGQGLGAAILPGQFAEYRSGQLAVIRLKPEVRGRLVFAWRADGPPSPAGRAFVTLARGRLRNA
jgi:DNA-binding transcriptional LysR family regulator